MFPTISVVLANWSSQIVVTLSEVGDGGSISGSVKLDTVSAISTTERCVSGRIFLALVQYLGDGLVLL